MTGICEGRIAIVTGAGRGIGREHALSLARQGAKVVVNDLGGNVDGTGGDLSPAEHVVEEIKAMGGEAVANGDDVSSWEGAQRLINAAVETFGDLHAVVNNAGILRDRMLTNMTEEEWDAVIKVHLKGTFAPSRWAAAYWREQVKAGRELDARIINTTSVSGIYGNPGQTNYGAAKMGIAAFTNIAALELARYGVTVNAVAPVALTRMTEGLGRGARDRRGARAALAPLDRPDRDVAGQPRVQGRDRAGVRGLGPDAGHRRGLAPWPAGRSGGGPGQARSDRGRPAGQGPQERRHGRRGRHLAPAALIAGSSSARWRSLPPRAACASSLALPSAPARAAASDRARRWRFPRRRAPGVSRPRTLRYALGRGRGSDRGRERPRSASGLWRLPESRRAR